MNILTEADQLTAQDRNAVYGHPADDFARTAAIATAMGFTRNGKPLEAIDVPMFQECVKMSRWAHTPDHRDTLTDIAGYARTAEMVINRRQGEKS
jgi:hypothetical protein